jgi:hypothetical protein
MRERKSLSARENDAFTFENHKKGAPVRPEKSRTGAHRVSDDDVDASVFVHRSLPGSSGAIEDVVYESRRSDIDRILLNVVAAKHHWRKHAEAG